jgi:nickel transport protein
VRRIVQRLLVAASLLCVFALVPCTASAHKLNVFACVEGSDVVVETYFSDGKGAREAAIEVYDADGALVATGKTGDDGEFRFAAPDTAGALRVVASTGEGHRGEYAMTADELSGAAPPGVGASTAEPTSDGGAEPRVDGGHNPDEIAARLDRIEAALRNVQRQLAELRKPQAGPSLERVLTGLGFIVGLTGAAMFVAAVYKTKRTG